MGFDSTSIPRSPHRRIAELPTDEDIAGLVTVDDATFDQAKVARAVAAGAPNGAEVWEIVQRAREFVAGPLVIELVEGRWTTTEMLALEQRVLAGAVAGRGGGFGAADRTLVDRALGARPSLSDEQVAMVRRITSSGDQVEVVVGTPGSGKTFALDAARAAWTSSSHRVLGCALAAWAARGLQAGSGIPQPDHRPPPTRHGWRS